MTPKLTTPETVNLTVTVLPRGLIDRLTDAAATVDELLRHCEPDCRVRQILDGARVELFAAVGLAEVACDDGLVTQAIGELMAEKDPHEPSLKARLDRYQRNIDEHGRSVVVTLTQQDAERLQGLFARFLDNAVSTLAHGNEIDCLDRVRDQIGDQLLEEAVRKQEKPA